MANRYTMVEGNKRGKYDLYCYENDRCVWEDEFKSREEAQSHGDRFLNKDDWFKLEQPA